MLRIRLKSTFLHKQQNLETGVMTYGEQERRCGSDRRSGKERRKAQRRKSERRKHGINIELILQGIAIRRSGLDRRLGERRKGERKMAWSMAT